MGNFVDARVAAFYKGRVVTAAFFISFSTRPAHHPLYTLRVPLLLQQLQLQTPTPAPAPATATATATTLLLPHDHYQYHYCYFFFFFFCAHPSDNVWRGPVRVMSTWPSQWTVNERPSRGSKQRSACGPPFRAKYPRLMKK